MAKTSGSTRSGGGGGGYAISNGRKIRVDKPSDLATIKENAVYRDAKSAISRYHAVLGVRQQQIKLANMSSTVLGAHATEGGKSSIIYLNRKYYNQSREAIIKASRKRYDEGWSTRTNKPIAHTITHELAHATWNNHLTGENQRAAAPAIRKLYNQWARDSKKQGYGKYAYTNINEFWAETVTKAVHGRRDYYTDTVKKIIKDYQL